MEKLETQVYDRFRAKGMEIPINAQERTVWQERFNGFAPMVHGGGVLDLEDDRVVKVTLPELKPHHRGGLGTKAANGAVISGLFDCALGVAGTLQFPGQRTGTVELSIKLMRPAMGPSLRFYSVATKRSASLVFVESELVSNGRLCASASGLVAVAKTDPVREEEA